MSETKEDSESDSGSDAEGLCPECTEDISMSGLHGHLRFAHGYSSEEASSALQNLKGESADPRGAVEGGGDSGASQVDLSGLNDRLENGVDALSAAKVYKMLFQDDDDDDPLDQIVKMQEVGLIGGGGDIDDDVKRELAELKGQINQMERQPAQQPAADGSGSLVQMAMAQGQSDPEVLKELAQIDPKRKAINRRYDMIERGLDTVTDALSGGVVQQMVGAALTAAEERQQGSRGAANQEQEQEQEQATARSPHAQKYGPGGDGSDDEIRLKEDAFEDDDGGGDGD